MALLSSYPFPLASHLPALTSQAAAAPIPRNNFSVFFKWCARPPTPTVFRIGESRNVGEVRTLVRAEASKNQVAQTGGWGEPVSLGTAKLPADVNLQKLEGYLYQWGSSLTQNADLPLPVPLKVDKIDGGVRLGYIKVTDGVVEDLVHIDCLVSPATSDSDAIFRALRNGRYKDQVPPGESAIMQSLLQALRKSIQLSKT